MHLLTPYDLPRDILNEFPDLEVSVTKLIKEELEEKLQKSFDHYEKLPVEVSVQEGTKSDLLLQFTRDKKITLTLLGKKLATTARVHCQEE